MNSVRALLLLLCFSAAVRAEDFQGSTHALPYDEAVINYSGRTPADPVALLQERLAGGATALAWDDRFGYLPALLEALDVPKSSQMLVFSKTSLQRSHISPENPRALFYNDDVYVGYIPGAPAMEVSAVDPQLGAFFYTVEQEKAQPARFTRTTDCLSCHAAGRSLGVPGHILRSIATDRRGEIDTQNERSPVDPTMPLAERWAGWYVTGRHGAQTHLGNLIGESAFARQLTEPNHLGNLTELNRFIEVEKYPAPGSDITALMVLEHQAHMHNYITRLHYEAQLMLAMYGHVRYLKNQVNAFLRCLLFTEETPLSEPVVGNPEFASQFVAAGPARSPRALAARLGFKDADVPVPLLVSHLLAGVRRAAERDPRGAARAPLRHSHRQGNRPAVRGRRRGGSARDFGHPAGDEAGAAGVLARVNRRAHADRHSPFRNAFGS
jgi:hypothetical protein